MNKESLVKLCEGIYNDSNNLLNWNWDEHFKTVLSQISSDNKDKALNIVSTHFEHTFDHSNVQNAPENAKMVIGDLGGLRPGQIFFFHELGEGNNVFGAWWPWGNGQTISIRIGFSIGSGNTEMNQKLKSLFGIN